MKRIALLVLVLALAGCGGGSTSVSTSKTKAAPDAAQTLRALVRAAHDGDDAAIGRLLTRDSRPSASELGEGLGTFAGKPVRRLYRGGPWAVAETHGTRTAEGTKEYAAYAAALHLVAGRWRVDLSGAVQIRILGPEQGEHAARLPQAAVELTSKEPLAESGLWIDGEALDVKGGGTTTRGTIYGAPRAKLAPGWHVAVGFGRTATHGTAVAWAFRV